MKTNLPVDQAAAEVTYAARFRPARIENIPMGVWVEFPIQFSVPQPRPDDPDRPVPPPGPGV